MERNPSGLPSPKVDGLRHGVLTHSAMKTEFRIPLGWILADKFSRMRPDMIVLIMFGYADRIKISHGVLESEIAFLPKSFTPNKLLQ